VETILHNRQFGNYVMNGRRAANAVLPVHSAIRVLSVKVGDASAPFSIVKRRSRAETRGMLGFQKAIQHRAQGRR
jgi:hypothetical protein